MAEEDIIWGKNRHFYGGMEPSNLLKLLVEADVAKVRVTISLPKDTVIENQTLCTVGGAIVRRSISNYPKDEFDGTLVKDIKSDETFIDESSAANGTYYYSVFPYTTQGVYNRNKYNRVVYNEPKKMVSFKSISMYDAMNDEALIRLTAVIPDNVIGAKIRRSTTNYPTNENEGTEVFDVTANGDYDDKNITIGTKYYYSAFPYSATGAYNRDAENRTAVIAEKLDGPAPKDMQTFNVALDSSARKLKITAVLPTNTVSGGETICTVAGAVIRRSTTTYPKDEHDGTLLATLKENKTFYDDSANIEGTYYYAAFPYSIQGVYNRNSANRVVFNEPDGMVEFTSKSVYNAATEITEIQLKAVLPESVIGAVIRRSTTNYPVDETDGELFINIEQDGTYSDKNVVVGTEYFYSAFPYTATGAHNYDTGNRTSAVATKYLYLFGYDLVKSEGNPGVRVTYPAGVDNTNYSRAYMNFSAGTFNYGNWPSQAGNKFMPKPCMVKYDGVVAYYLNPDDYSKKIDGSTSDIGNTSFGGNAMMEWPKIYTKREFVNGVYKFRCCDIKMDDSYECWCNYDKNNKEIPNFYTPIYFGSEYSGKLRSLAGRSNYVNHTAQDEINLAKANGTKWYTEVVADRFLINDLLVMMGKNTDTQATFGQGVVGASSAIQTGTMNTKGLFWGSSSKTSGVKVFGMENYWGNVYRRTAGWIFQSGNHKIKVTRGTKDGTTVSDYNTDGSGYLSTGVSISGSSGGYISGQKVESYGCFPNELNGSATTFEADAAYFTSGGPYYAFVGGAWTNDSRAGAFCADLSAGASGASSSIGAALSCK